MRNHLTLLLLGGTLVILSGTAGARENASFNLVVGTPVATYVQPAPVYYTPRLPRVVYDNSIPAYFGPTARVIYINRDYDWNHHWHGSWRQH
jgi:hypothetical protein